jgi:two-component system, NtrC family, sensor kinase
MIAPPDNLTADVQNTIAQLRQQFSERTAERDAALAREAALADVLRRRNASPGDPTPVFDNILNRAMRLCSAAHGHIWAYDSQRAYPVAVRGQPEFVGWMQKV